jgi:hypothetical protein
MGKPFIPKYPCTFQQHSARIERMLLEKLHTGKEWSELAHDRYLQLEEEERIAAEKKPDVKSEHVEVEGLYVKASYGREVYCDKLFGPLSVPPVRVYISDGLELVIEIQVCHEFPPDSNEYPAHDVRECAICAGDVWQEIYRGNGPCVDHQPRRPGGWTPEQHGQHLLVEQTGLTLTSKKG